MHIVHVHVHVKEEYIQNFIDSTIENARNSLLEPGIVRFDIIQQQDDLSRFVLLEVYRTYEDPAKHKKTEHYQRWCDEVAHMMKEPRTSVKYYNIHPEEEAW